MSTQTLKPGDVCIGQNLRHQPEYNGMECVIVEPRNGVITTGCTTGIKKFVQIGWRVRWADGDYSTQEPHELRLKRPPPDEFQPAEPEFVSDLLKRLNKVKA